MGTYTSSRFCFECMPVDGVFRSGKMVANVPYRHARLCRLMSIHRVLCVLWKGNSEISRVDTTTGASDKGLFLMPACSEMVAGCQSGGLCEPRINHLLHQPQSTRINPSPGELASTQIPHNASLPSFLSSPTTRLPSTIRFSNLLSLLPFNLISPSLSAPLSILQLCLSSSCPRPSSQTRLTKTLHRQPQPNPPMFQCPGKES